jgi:hypothetical protein
MPRRHPIRCVPYRPVSSSITQAALCRQVPPTSYSHSAAIRSKQESLHRLALMKINVLITCKISIVQSVSATVASQTRRHTKFILLGVAELLESRAVCSSLHLEGSSLSFYFDWTFHISHLGQFSARACTYIIANVISIVEIEQVVQIMLACIHISFGHLM